MEILSQRVGTALRSWIEEAKADISEESWTRLAMLLDGEATRNVRQAVLRLVADFLPSAYEELTSVMLGADNPRTAAACTAAQGYVFSPYDAIPDGPNLGALGLLDDAIVLHRVLRALADRGEDVDRALLDRYRDDAESLLASLEHSLTLRIEGFIGEAVGKERGDG